jgi:hypothetical protein
MASRPDPAGGAGRRAVRAGVAELASHSAGAVSLCMPLEGSGQEWFGFAYGDDWQRHAGLFAAEHAKVLVRDNPGLDPVRREQQATRLGQVSSWAARTGRSLILELLVPATGADKDATGGNLRRYDHELRPGHILQVMEYLQDHGVEPAFWTVEGLGRHDDAVAVAAMAQRAGRQARCLVGGRHASYDALEHWLQVAAPIPGWAGFAIGRSIWWGSAARPPAPPVHRRGGSAPHSRRLPGLRPLLPQGPGGDAARRA